VKNKHIIFLDTSIFESENFFKGRNLLHICELSQNGLIEVKITDITYNEIINRIKENIQKSQTSFKKANSLINGEGKLLKNLDEFSIYFNFPKIESEDLLIQFKIKLEQFIKDNLIEIIDSKVSNLKEVFENYFNLLPPFKEGKKKSEFPDAFTYSTIKEWSILNKTYSYFISNDTDFEHLTTENIICSYNLSSIIDLITREIDEKHTKYIDTIYDKYTEKIIFDLEGNFENNLIEAVYDEISNDPFYEEPEIDLPYNIEVELKFISLNELNINTNFSYEIESEIYFAVDVEFIDYSMGFYDKEDGIWYGEERINQTKNYIATVIAIAEFWYNLEDEYDEFYAMTDFKIKKIEEI
jgi:PIN domain